MRHHFFITGTDTGVGKTTLAALLCAALDAVYWKPIQTGTLEGSDRVTVMRLAGMGTDRTLEEVYKFVPPVSPDLAARWASVEIDLARINLPTTLNNDWLIVEGAGGVHAHGPVEIGALLAEARGRQAPLRPAKQRQAKADPGAALPLAFRRSGGRTLPSDKLKLAVSLHHRIGSL